MFQLFQLFQILSVSVPQFQILFLPFFFSKKNIGMFQPKPRKKKEGKGRISVIPIPDHSRIFRNSRCLGGGEAFFSSWTRNAKFG